MLDHSRATHDGQAQTSANLIAKPPLPLSARADTSTVSSTHPCDVEPPTPASFTLLPPVPAPQGSDVSAPESIEGLVLECVEDLFSPRLDGDAAFYSADAPVAVSVTLPPVVDAAPAIPNPPEGLYVFAVCCANSSASSHSARIFCRR